MTDDNIDEKKTDKWFCGKWKKELCFVKYCIANACEHLYKKLSDDIEVR